MSTPLVPPLRLTHPDFRYTSSVETNVQRTFEKCPQWREFQAQQKKRRMAREANDDRR